MKSPPLNRCVQLHPDDDVAVALETLQPGEIFAGTLVARTVVKAGHKVAVRDVPQGAAIRKYGQVIGLASTQISAGDHVHTHNLGFGGQAQRAPTGVRAAPALTPKQATFLGYPRASGRAGTRNYIGILTSVNCSATVARKIASAFERERLPTGIDGVVAFTHTTGCGTAKSGDGVDNLTRTIMGYARNPNFAAVLLIGLGCEVNQIDRMLSEQGLIENPRLRTFTIQDQGGTLAAIEFGKEIVRELIAVHGNDRRVPVSASNLMIGLQCGGSDGWSGITANPSLGAAADLVVAHGGTVILSETPEIYGAESLLLGRAASLDVAEGLLERIAWWEDYAARHGADLNNNPSPGNIEGGITTILEKSLGAVAKSGSSLLNGVYRYAEKIDASGFVFMDSPGYDPCSATGQIGSGANLIAFTTGRGSVFGSKPAPCLKLASNAEMARHMSDDMDIDCSPILTGTTTAEMGQVIFERLLATASGQPTKSEELGLGDHEFVPWQLGAWM